MKILLIVLALTSVANGIPIAPDDIRPINHNPDSELYWGNCEYAYDKDNTFAYQLDASSSEPLELIFGSPYASTNMVMTYFWNSEEFLDPTFELWVYGIEAFSTEKKWHLWHSTDWPLPSGPRLGIGYITHSRIISLDPDVCLYIADFHMRAMPEPATLLLLGAGFLILRRLSN